MRKVLIPVDGSDAALRAVVRVAEQAKGSAQPPKIHLLNVQRPLSGNVSMFVGDEQVKRFHQDEGIKALARAKQVLDQAGFAYREHIKVGEPADVIAREAEQRGCDQIVMGTRGLGPIGGMLLGSVATKVLHLAKVPVTFVK